MSWVRFGQDDVCNIVDCIPGLRAFNVEMHGAVDTEFTLKALTLDVEMPFDCCLSYTTNRMRYIMFATRKYRDRN